jgi:hypothetical protein
MAGWMNGDGKGQMGELLPLEDVMQLRVPLSITTSRTIYVYVGSS